MGLVRRAIGLFAAIATIFALLPALPAGADPKALTDPDRHVAYSPYIHSSGWGEQKWDGDIAGTMDPLNQRVEAWDFLAGGAGRLCVEARLADFGWQNERCGDGTLLVVGAPGWGLDVEGLGWHTETGRLCMRFNVVLDDQSVIWAGPYCTGTERTALSWSGRITAISAWYE